MKILIEVATPGNGKSYEIVLDDRLSVKLAKEKIIEQIDSYENGCIAFDKSVALFAHNSHARLPDERNLRSAGLRGGQTVFLL